MDLERAGVDTCSLRKCTLGMASQKVKTRLRITGGLLIITGGVLIVMSSIVFAKMPRIQAPNVWMGIALGLGVAGMMVLGTVLVAGRTWAGRPEGADASTWATLTDRNAKTWNLIVLVAAVAGVLLCCLGMVATVTGNLALGSVLVPFAVIFLVFATLMWTQLRSVKRQAKGAP